MLLNFQNSETSDFTAQDPLLDNLLNQTQQQLSEFVQSNNVNSVLETAFATEPTPLLIQNLITGKFLENLEIRPSNELEGALGAYAENRDTVYLSEGFLTQATVEEATGVLLEEVGHAVDDFLNDTEAPGDEGEMFASLVQVEELSNQELASLRQEDDSATLNIDNESVAVEQAELTVINTNNSGEGSLRNAIEQANNNNGADTITFDNSLSGETIDLTSGLTSGQLQITESLTIEGLGAEQLTIDANESSRVFKIDNNSDTDNINVVIKEITIKGGSVTSSGSSEGNGGGIFNAETLTLNDSTVSGNFAENNSGGIYNYGGSLTLNSSTISGNSAGDDGGGIYNSDGSLTLNNSTVSDNSASDGAGIRNNGTFSLKNSTISNNSAEYGSTPSGGGIDNFGGTIDITNSTISNNVADLTGGIDISSGTINLTNSTVSDNSGTGIDNGGTLNIISSTISGNSADSDGGGIRNSQTLNLTNTTVSNNLAGSSGGGIDNGGGTANLTNSTISNNSAGSDGGGIDQFRGTLTLANSTISGNSTGESGAGINNTLDVNFTLSNSIIANNVNGADVNSDEETVINTNGTNIVKDGSIAGTLNVDPNLSPLQDNGGPTLTQAPQGDSPAIDTGISAAIPADTFDLDGDGDTEEQIPFDQRGEDFDRVVNGTVDLGAVEVQQEPTEIPVNIADFEATEGNANETTTFTFTVSLNQSPSQELTVDFATSDGTATAGEDYVATDGTLTFEQGVTEQTIEVPVLGDNNNENDETFTVELSDPTGGLTLSDSTATGTIQNDDGEIQLNTVILTGTDQQITIPFNADIRGTAGEETLLIEDGVTASFNPQSGDRVDVVQPLTDYTIERTGLTELALTDSNGGETITFTVNQNQAFELRFPGGDTTVDLNSDGEILVGNEAIGVNEQANLENIDLGDNSSEIASLNQSSSVLEPSNTQISSFSENAENELVNNALFSSDTGFNQANHSNLMLEVQTNNLEKLDPEVTSGV